MQPESEIPVNILTASEFEQLDTLIESAALNKDEDADIFVALGYLSAQAMFSNPPNFQHWLADLFSQELEANLAENLIQLLKQALSSAQQGLYQGSGLELPFALDFSEHNYAISDWSAGFLEVFFAQHSEQDELAPDLAELLVPIMALSGLFAAEEDFADISKDPSLLQQFTQGLPDLLLDIYCQLNAPEIKK